MTIWKIITQLTRTLKRSQISIRKKATSKKTALPIDIPTKKITPLLSRSELFIRELLIAEGGYVNHKADTGKETYKGISRRYWGEWAGWVILDKIPNKKRNASYPELDDLVNQFYFKNFYAKNKKYLDGITSDLVAYCLFDMGVNSSYKVGIKTFQRAVNLSQVEKNKNITVDGYLGKNTIKTSNLLCQETLLTNFCDLRIKFYQGIVKRKPSQSVFLKGWINRITHLKTISFN